jgi:hypothetical protein
MDTRVADSDPRGDDMPPLPKPGPDKFRDLRGLERRKWEVEYCRSFIDHQCIYRSPSGTHSLIHGSGSVNCWQFYMPVALLNQDFMDTLCMLFWDAYEPQYKEREFQLCGVESGGSLLVSLLQGAALRRGLTVSACMIKKAPKMYGLKNWFEGIIHESLPLVLVDDVVASGLTLRKARDRCKAEGLMVDDMFTICSSKTSYQQWIPETNVLLPVDLFHRTFDEYVLRYGHEPRFHGSLI